MLRPPAPRRACTDLSFFSASKRSSKGASSSSSPPTVVVTTRVIQRPVAPPQSRSSGSSSSVSPPACKDQSSPLSKPIDPVKKRKKVPQDDLEPRSAKRPRAAPAKEKPRKSKSAATSKASSRGTSRSAENPPPPEPLYRSSKSRSTSLFPHLDSDKPIAKRNWRTDEDGLPGEHFLSSELVVKTLIKSYKAYFRNPQDPNDPYYFFDPLQPSQYPVVELEYPNCNASERYILLAPKDKDHYNPIMDLETTLYTIIEFYCTKEQQALFGHIPTDTLSEMVSRSSSPCFEGSLPISSSTSRPSAAGSEFLARPPTAPPLLKTLKRALNREDGPAFIAALDEINALLRFFKYSQGSNMLMQAPPLWVESGFPRQVMMRMVEENYQRTVGPNVQTLRKYEAFSSTVYGELMPNFVDEIVRLTDLKEDSLFLDLGSGVGNVVVQASLQSGCKSFGVELMESPARVAVSTVEQIKIRCRMWGVNIGEMELEKGDMLLSSRLSELMPKADVVLVDNKVFEESLNEALRPRFLDLKEGAIVISLAPFANSSKSRFTERNVDDISAIFEVTEREYRSGSVSWGNGGGPYFIHRVDRTGYAEIRAKFENGRALMTRTSRRRH